MQEQFQFDRERFKDVVHYVGTILAPKYLGAPSCIKFSTLRTCSTTWMRGHR